MDIFGPIVLLIIILLALNHMAGGKPGTVLRPVSRIAGSLIHGAVRVVLSLFGSAANQAGKSLNSKVQSSLNDDHNEPKGPTPPRW